MSEEPNKTQTPTAPINTPAIPEVKASALSEFRPNKHLNRANSLKPITQPTKAGELAKLVAQTPAVETNTAPEDASTPETNDDLFSDKDVSDTDLETKGDDKDKPDQDKREAHIRREQRKLREKQREIDEWHKNQAKFMDNVREQNKVIQLMKEDPIKALQHRGISPQQLADILWDRREELGIFQGSSSTDKKESSSDDDLSPAMKKRLEAIEKKEQERDQAEKKRQEEESKASQTKALTHDNGVISDLISQHKSDLEFVQFYGTDAVDLIREECYRLGKLGQKYDIVAIATKLEKIYEKSEQERLTRLPKKLQSKKEETLETKPVVTDQHPSDTPVDHVPVVKMKPNLWTQRNKERMERFDRLIK